MKVEDVRWYYKLGQEGDSGDNFVGNNLLSSTYSGILGYKMGILNRLEDNK